MARSEKTPDEIDAIADRLVEIADRIRETAETMRENEIPTLTVHVDDLTGRILPTVEMWSVKTDFQLRKVLIARGTRLEHLQPQPKQPRGRPRKS